MLHLDYKFTDFKDEIIRGNRVHIYKAVLKDTPCRCPECGLDEMIRYGYRETKTKLVSQHRIATFLFLKKQKFRCKNCQSMTTVELDLVDPHCQIANQLKLAILTDGKDDMSAKLIGAQNHVSGTTVQRIWDAQVDLTQFNRFTYLPENICMDEFQGTTNANLVWGDNDRHELCGVLDSRKTWPVKRYFLRFPLAQRQKVKSVTIDLNAGYINFMKELFPNAKIIIDRFHIIQAAKRELSKSRIQLMKRYPKNSLEYRLLKRGWKLLEMRFDRVEQKELHYSKAVNYRDTQMNIIHKALSLDKQYKDTYEYFQALNAAVMGGDDEVLRDVVTSYTTLSNGMDTINKTYMKNLDAILNATRYKYSNGFIEGVNRKIKQIKRTAYGYQNWHNMRTRIYLQFMVFKKSQSLPLLQVA